MRRLRNGLARFVVVLADEESDVQLTRNKTKTPPDSKTNHATAFFDSIGQTEKNSVRAYVFRFALKLGHCSVHEVCLKGAKSRYRFLFDHLVGEREQGRGHDYAKRSGSLEIDL